MTTAPRSAWADDDVVALKEMATKFFQTERLVVAVWGVAVLESAVEETVKYAKDRAEEPICI